MIHVLTNADERFSPGLLVMAASALVALPADEKITFHILDGGIAPRTLNRLKRTCTRLHDGCTVKNYPINEEEFRHMPLGPGGSRMNYARLRVGSLLDVAKVLYLDSDILVLKNLSEIWRADMGGNVGLACADFISQLGMDCPWPLAEEEKAFPYFNSGLMVLDLAKWRALGVEEAILKLAGESGSAYKLHDQTLLNYVLRGKVGIIDPTWNWVQPKVSDGPKLMAANLHFTGQKPWLFWDGSLRFRLWRLYYRKLVGQLSELFFTKSGRTGFIGGWSEIIIRSHPLIRTLYVNVIELRIAAAKDERAKAELGALHRYYTKGPGGPDEDAGRFFDRKIVGEVRERLWQKLLAISC